MPIEILIDRATGTPPYSVYLCALPDETPCILVYSGLTSLPFYFIVPDEFDIYEDFIVKVIDSNNCEIIEDPFPSPTPTPTITPTITPSQTRRPIPSRTATPTPTPTTTPKICNCYTITCINEGCIATYVDCDDNPITISDLQELEEINICSSTDPCGKNICIIEQGPCIDNNCPTPTPTPVCSGGVEITAICTTPTPTPVCSGGVEITAICTTPTPTPVCSGGVEITAICTTPTPTPVCDNEIEITAICVTPMVTPTCTNFVTEIDETIPSIPPQQGPYSVRSIILGQSQILNYSSFGSLIYDTNYNISGNGTILNTLITVGVWRNTSNGQRIGPLLRSGVWTNDPELPRYRWVGFSVCIEVATPKIYYIGMGGDNYVAFKLNGNIIVRQPFNPTNRESNFKYWHIYPVFMNSGTNVIECFGLNEDLIAGFGFEIYENTRAQLINATSLSNLNIIYSTANKIGSTFDLVLNPDFTQTNYGYTCPNGYVYLSCLGLCAKFKTVCV